MNQQLTRVGIYLVRTWWGDGTSRNDVSPYESSVTPGRLDESSRKPNVTMSLHIFIPAILHQPKRIV